MKAKIKLIVLLLGLIIGATAIPQQLAAQEVSLQVFYDNLAPYGHWIDNPNYGYVWIPDAGPDFVPYSTAGYWENTEYGWTWISDYPWGWAAFHYGRWDFDSYYGWYWIPDVVWGPAWVAWRRAPGYYGWAPLGPGISIEYAYGGGWRYPDDRWIFCNETYLGRRDMDRYYERRENAYEIEHRSNYITNTYEDRDRHRTYVYGPRRDEVERVTHTQIRPLAVHEVSRPDQTSVNEHDHQVNIYRPTITKTEGRQGNSPAPKRVENVQNIGHNRPQPSDHPAAPAGGENVHGRQDAPRDYYNPRKTQNNATQSPNVPAPEPRQQPQQRPMDQPRPEQPQRPIEQVRPQQPPRQMEQPRPEPQARPMEQPRPQPQQPPRQMEQPRPEPQARPMEQPRPQQQPRQMEQPRMQQAPPRMSPQPAPAPHGGEGERRR